MCVCVCVYTHTHTRRVQKVRKLFLCSAPDFRRALLYLKVSGPVLLMRAARDEYYNTDGMALTEENPSARRRTSPSVNFSTTNITRPGPGSNPDLLGTQSYKLKTYIKKSKKSQRTQFTFVTNISRCLRKWSALTVRM